MECLDSSARFRFHRGLALDAQARPRQRFQAFRRNRFFAAFTFAVGAFPDTIDRRPYLANRARMLIQRFDRQIPIRAQANLIQWIG